MNKRMTLDDLAKRIDQYRAEYGGDAEVMIMANPHWPMEHGICGVVANKEISEEDNDPSVPPVVYIVAGMLSEYGNKAAWKACH